MITTAHPERSTRAPGPRITPRRARWTEAAFRSDASGVGAARWASASGKTRPPVGLTLLLAAVLLALATAFLAPQPAHSAALGSDRELLAAELQRTDAILQRVGEGVQQTNNPRLRDLFIQAVKIQKRAKWLFERAGVEIDAQTKLHVLELTRRSRDLALRVQREVRQGVTYEERARRLLEQSRTLLERIDEHDDQIHDRRVRAVLDKVRDQLGAAERQFADGNFEVAFRIAQSSHTLLRNLVQAARQRMSRERLEEELRRTDQLIERVMQRVGGTERLGQARRLQERAHQAFSSERNEQALQLTLQARRMVRQLLGDAQGLATHEDVEQALERFDARLERVQQHLEDSSDPQAGRLVDQARRARRRAVEADAQGDYDRALQQLRTGLDLLNRAAGRLGAQDH